MYLLSKRLNYGSEHNTNKNTNCGPISKNCGPISENPNMVCIIFFLSIYFLPQFYSFFQKSENKTGEWYVLYFIPQSLFSLREYFLPKIYLLPQFHNRRCPTSVINPSLWSGTEKSPEKKVGDDLLNPRSKRLQNELPPAVSPLKKFSFKISWKVKHLYIDIFDSLK